MPHDHPAASVAGKRGHGPDASATCQSSVAFWPLVTISAWCKLEHPLSCSNSTKRPACMQLQKDQGCPKVGFKPHLNPLNGTLQLSCTPGSGLLYLIFDLT
ncbi:growth factor receptor-bound protein 14 [Platysternon megacephalum]|uniref:Growth factor receptor-bound protein 14 n=1 Tax=Platysternon megacephalum TaxID=55544 RepID=A0A4D9EVZ3_9SAUR|nr:growth factor receptor-bound protein 14 [Platysternon megacephalum]